MKEKNEYLGIDAFRIIAVCLIVAVHTSPLASYSETADFIFTRIIARVGVPFFFMATGFFLLPDYIGVKNTDNVSIVKFVRKTARLYLIAILLYLPVNIYAGIDLSAHSIIRDLIFDGTLYHLWYLPAAITGVVLLHLLLRKFTITVVTAFAILLYLIGLFGDSYYGIMSQNDFLKQVYNGIFFFSSYTRNGLFFAPIFILMGGLIAKQGRAYSTAKCVLGFSAAHIALFIEGLTLHYAGVQHHDSMYISLLPCMFFLFQLLLLWKGESKKMVRIISMTVYVIHPLLIILVRGFAKIINLQRLFIDNSAVHYIVVLLCSFAVAFCWAAMLNYDYTRKTKNRNRKKDRAWIEINFSNLRHNVWELKKILPKQCKLMAVVKANAYGHGDVEISAELNRIGIRSFAVATIDEGIRLRKNGIAGEILVLGFTAPERAKELRRYQLMQTVINHEHAMMLEKTGFTLPVHIKVDSGMHRLGEAYDDFSDMDEIFKCKNLNICGIYTHLCVSDSREQDGVEFTKLQIKSFYGLLDQMKQLGHKIPDVHIQSSYGALNYPELQCDYARIGIALYGALSAPDDKTKINADLRPVMSIKARIVLTRDIAAGESIGYGRKFQAEKSMRIAIVSIGYADGLPRNLSGTHNAVLINGQYAEVLGRICMDQLMVDITNIPDAEQNGIVTIIGRDMGAQITAEQVARNAKTITNELLSKMGNRLTRFGIRGL